MKREERQFLLTSVWMFMRHGQRMRARKLCAALVEDDPHDGVAACAYAELLLEEGEAREALDALMAADIPPSLVHAGAVLESRALRSLGKVREADSRWRRHLESQKGAARKWVT
ncbi:MAG: hypothetical protein K6F50_10185 [Kiritimatiellae bacterium]|nr:hypothetical protein [Kiritimatiellia bacterium]